MCVVEMLKVMVINYNNYNLKKINYEYINIIA